MYCSSCGKEISNDAKFCTYCGKPTSASPIQCQKEDSVNWEYCQIQARWKFDNRWSIKYECYFWADAIGSRGSYCAAQTQTYILEQKWVWETPVTPPFGNNEKARQKAYQILNNLITTLQRDGWELLQERGTYDWSYKFRRKEKGFA